MNGSAQTRRARRTGKAKVVQTTTVVRKRPAQAPLNVRRQQRQPVARRPNGFSPRPFGSGGTLGVVSRTETAKEAIGPILGINGFASNVFALHPSSFQTRLNVLAARFALYRFTRVRIRLDTTLAGNDRGQFGIGFDYSASATVGTDYTSIADILTTGGVSMQAGQSKGVWLDLDCSRFSKRAFQYQSFNLNTGGGTAVFEDTPGWVVIGVAGTPVNGQTVANVEIEYSVVLEHPVKLPSDHAIGNSLAPTFATTVDASGVFMSYDASKDQTRRLPLSSLPHLAFKEKGEGVAFVPVPFEKMFSSKAPSSGKHQEETYDAEEEKDDVPFSKLVSGSV